MVVDINLTPTASYIDIVRAKSGAVADADELAKSLPARSWGNPAGCLAGAVLVHGLGAHSGWFEALGRRLKVRRIYSIAYDQVGFGRRFDEKFTSYTQWLDDLKVAMRFARETVGDKPVFLLGNSMGAAVAFRAIADGDLKVPGLIMCSPGFEGNSDVFTLPFKVKALAQAFLTPDESVQLPYGTEMVTRDQSALRWISKDPERKFAVPARMLFELLKLNNDLTNRARKINCPSLLFDAGIDKIVDSKVTRRVFQHMTCVKEHVNFPEAYHDLMFDPVIDDMSEQLVAWITKTLEQHPTDTRLPTP